MAIHVWRPGGGLQWVQELLQRILDGVAQQFGEIGPQQLSAFDFALGRDQGFARLRWLVESGE